MILALLFSLCAVGMAPASATSKEMDERYREPFAQLYRQFSGQDDFWRYCWVDYYHYPNDATGDESTPDFIAVFCEDSGLEFSIYSVIIGDYYISTGLNSLYEIGTYIYTPSDGNIYTLTEAYASGIDGVEEMLSEHYDELTVTVKLLGDLDRDHKLTVKDATKLQKCLVGVEEFGNGDNLNWISVEQSYPMNKITRYISDFNRDGDRNVKDATAIQKRVAGLE